LTVGCFIK